MALPVQQDHCSPLALVMFVILLLLATHINAEHRIPEELTSHRNWKLLDRGDDCGIAEASRIIGGTEATLGQYPWMARIGYSNDLYSDLVTEYTCGGVIISSQYVMTAAHCGSGMESSSKRIVGVRLGEHFTNQEEDCDKGTDMCADPVQDLEVEAEVCHPGYVHRRDFDNDICLLRVQGLIEMNMFVSPICMPAYDFMINGTAFHKGTVETAGWGINYLKDEDDFSTSDVLLTLKMKVVDQNSCFFQYSLQNNAIELTERQMCAGGEKGKDSCSGDSGGPLMKVCSVNSVPRYFLLGLVSYGQTLCAAQALPGVYTVVAKYWQWILDNIQE